jgi:peptidoglycan/xylan/chitin deacetylase (PgdA/CDA1 family)
MRPEQRLRYVAAIDRPAHVLPGGAKLAVWPVVNVEHWLIDNPMPRQVLTPPTGAALLPDLPNWAWHEYGMRVGFWRFLRMFEARGIRPTLSINGSVCTAYPRVAGAARDAGWEFMGHGFVQVPTHRVADQRGMIHDTVAAIRDFTGTPCAGWLGPGLTETPETPDLLAEAGIRYVGDWVVDDLPCRIATAHGPLVALPYSVELNDIPVAMIQHHDAAELPRRARATARRLLAEGRAAIMGIAIHPYITGVPHRIDAFEALLDDLAALPGVAFLEGVELLDWYLGTGDPA